MADPIRKTPEGFEPEKATENLGMQEVAESSISETIPAQVKSVEQEVPIEQSEAPAQVDASKLSIESALEPPIIEAIASGEKRVEDIKTELYDENDIKTDDSSSARELVNKIMGDLQN